MLMIRYLLSRLNYNEDFDKELISYLKKDIVSRERIVFIPTTPKNILLTKKYANEIIRLFEINELVFKDVTILHSEIETTLMGNFINNADVIFLMGGDTLCQYKFLKENDLIEPITNFKGVVIGLSAGAVNMCKNAILTSVQETKEIIIFEGLNLVDFSIEVHFDKDSYVQKKDLLKIISENQIETVFGLSDTSGIRVSDKSIDFLGEKIYKVTKNKIFRYLR
ncbi:hypothetical protein GCM10008982_31880 [Anoxybacillus voinovskiensis]|nr:hypothetical protein GCM10008982_31880 [Anoxybacillus voinovskiensis]